ncbi:armadillo-type protein [Vararia minispora EC-137]|uniref:Armadillo-type protein n=1 Tax=Vararia minispora EC-137 TaxID=1314806 RepID=A0ACB8QNF1_9AGAM|nr:armadillo-type protein [Vararia minispora EC-137]
MPRMVVVVSEAGLIFLQSYVQGLHALLVQSTANDTLQLKAATAQLNREYYKNPACIPALATILSQSPEAPVRQLAAVELRKRIAQHNGDLWLAVAQQDRISIKANLPNVIVNEPQNLVRHSTARVVAAIAGIEIEQGTWPELLPWLRDICMSATAAHREIGVFILYSVLETIIDDLQSQLGQFLELFGKLLQDPESDEVRVTTVRALGIIAQYIDADDKDQIKMFQTIVPAMLQVIQKTLELGNSEGAKHVFDVFETMLILEAPLLGNHIPQFVEFLLQWGANGNLDDELRVLALNALTWTVQYKKSKIQAQNLGPAMLQGLLPITTEPEAEDADDDAPSRSALRIIDALATNLPPAQVFPALRELLQTYFASPDANYRRGGMLALGIVVEGCSEYMTPLMPQVWPIIDVGLQDSDPSVRKATCIAVSCLCEWVEEEAAKRHAVLVPAIMQLVDDPATQRQACTALDGLLEILQDAIGNYLQLIMERLSGLLESAPTSVKTVVVGAIGSAAHAAKSGFLPYFQPTMERVKHFLVLTGEGEEQDLRGIAMDAVGTFAEAVGKEVFRPYFPDLMQQAFKGIEMGSARLRECSFLFFGVMARVYGDEFAPWLPQVVPALIQSCKLEESGKEATGRSHDACSAFSTSGTSAADPITVIDGETTTEIEDVDIDKLLDVNSAIAVEKEIAADTMGTLFAATGNHFLQFVEPCTLELVSLLPHYYEGIRKSATDSLLEIIRTFSDLTNPAEWHPGPPSEQPELEQHVKQLIGHAIPALLEMYETEDNKQVAAAFCAGIAETTNKIGPRFVEEYLDQLCTIAVQILDQKALCQQDPDQDETDETPEDSAEYDSVLISAAGDLVAALANALGATFAQAFDTFFPRITKFYKKSRSLTDRSAAIGCLAEIISGLGGAVTKWTEPLLDLFYRALADSDAEVQSNAAFATGLLVEHSEMDLAPQYMPVLGALHPLFEVPEGASPAKFNARDNAAGAVSRLIVKNAGALPLEQVLPVLFSALPLRNDFLENTPVFRAIFHLFKANPAVLAPFLDGLLGVFAHVLDPSRPEQVGEETRAELIRLIGAINAEKPIAVQAAGLGAFV